MKPAISIALGLAFVMATAGAADAWRAAVGPRGGAAVAGPRGFAARGPNGGVYAGRGYGGAYRGYGGAYYGGRWGYGGYGAGAVAAGVAVAAAGSLLGPQLRPRVTPIIVRHHTRLGRFRSRCTVIARSEATKQSSDRRAAAVAPGLLRFARNDEARRFDRKLQGDRGDADRTRTGERGAVRQIVYSAAARV